MVARIYQPARNAMQSGQSKDEWLVEFPATAPKPVDPLMGWVGSSDTQSQVKMRFATKEAAIDYAKKHGLAYIVSEPKARKHRPRGYGDNFATSRRQSWTH